MEVPMSQSQGGGATEYPVFDIEDTQDLEELGVRSLYEDPPDGAGGGGDENFLRIPPESKYHQDCHSPCAEPDSQCECRNEPREKGNMDVHVQKCNMKRTNSAVEAGMQVYKMEAVPRGLALIIENEEFTNDVIGRRTGSHVDVSNLTKLFTGLSFEIVIKRNLNISDFHEAIRTFAKDPRHELSDMGIITILSHGRDSHIYTTDGRVVSTEKIYENFNNINCPGLQGKPKFFIIQACRGDNTDLGMSETSLHRMSPRAMRKRSRHGSDRDSNPFHELTEVNRARPTWEDMVIAYSTIPGFASIRDHQSGTWFIQSLVEVFMHHACDKELIDLLRMTSERLSLFTNEYNEKQTCNVEMRHLYKRIYFNPGFPRPAQSLIKRSHSTPPASPKRNHEQQEEQ